MAMIKRGVSFEDDNHGTKLDQEIALLEQQMLEARKSYYSTADGTVKFDSKLSDAEYDSLEKRLREIDPDNRVLTLVGAPEKSTFPKFEHYEAMLSLDKDYTHEGIEKFRDKRELAGSFKIDGNSLRLYYKSGMLILAATRGNGKMGVEVTANVKTISDIPLTLPNSFTGRITGEVYMRRDVFQEHVDRITLAGTEEIPSSPRNYAAGSLKQEDPRITFERKLNFMAYNLTDENFTFISKSDVFSRLLELGFKCPKNKIITVDIAMVTCIEEFDKDKEDLDYDVDGIVFEYNDLAYQESLGVTSHHPRGRIAFKWESEQAVSPLINVEQKVGRTGRITFTGIIEPVELSNATVQRFTLHNYEHIEKYNIRIGDKIRITRSGEVIPKFLKVEVHGTGEAIRVDNCPKCGQPVVREGVDLVCNNESCGGQALKRLIHFVEVVNIEELGKKNLEKFFYEGLIATPADLYRLTKEQLLKLEKFGDRSADIVIDNISKKRELPLDKFLTALGIEGLGKSVGVILAKRYKSLDIVQKLSEAELICIEGFGDITATQIVEGLAKNQDLINDLLTVVSIETVQVGNNDIGSFCLTGRVEFELNGKKYDLRKEIEDLIKSKGGSIKSTVGKDLTYLVCDEPSNSGKFQKATKSGVKIITGKDLVTILG